MKALDRLRVLARLHDLRDEPDAALVRRFAGARDEAAFELLVRRHGPLVLGVCRRALGDAAAADDAFQATFLLLARRAPALREPAGVARWLYGVAARTAREARRQERRRARREQRVARPEAVVTLPDDTAAAVEAAVWRLPEPYRSAVLLCDLSGRTRDQAAAELGVPPGTVASRLSRGRRLLAADLLRRGVTLGAAGLAVLVPAELTASTVRLAALLAAGEAAVPAAVGNLLIHGGRTMLPLGLWKVAVGVLVLGGAAVLGGGGQKPADPPPRPAAVRPAEAKRGPTPAERLAKLRAEYSAAFAAVADAQRAAHEAGKPVPDLNGPSSQPERFLPTLLELGESADEATAAAALSFAVHAYHRKHSPLPDAEKAWRRLLERFRDSPHLRAFADEPYSTSGGPEELEAVLLMLAGDHAVRGRLELRLATHHDPSLRRIEGPPRVAEYDDYRRDLAATRYRRVMEKYADVDGGELARRAGRQLARMTADQAPPKHLVVGRPAPPTAGVDLDGRPLELADNKGKVVVLEFWGSWCGPCVRAVPGLKQLSADYADRGVVVLGVMSDTSAEAARKTVAELQVPWRNWLDLRADGRSPLVAAWDVRRFPTTVVIDRAGVIRAVDPAGREGLVKALDEVLAAKP